MPATHRCFQIKSDGCKASKLNQNEIQKGLLKLLRNSGVEIMFGQEKYLLALNRWVATQIQTDGTLNADLFTSEVVLDEYRLMLGESTLNVLDPLVKAPAKFSGNTPWLLYTENMHAFLITRLNANGVPLTYVIRKNILISLYNNES